MNYTKKITISIVLLAASILVITNVVPANKIAHAQSNTLATTTSMGSSFKKAIDATKENGARNSALRNQLLTDHSSDLQNKEKNLVDQLNLTLMNLENIQNRITEKTVEAMASGTDVTLVKAWLATSTNDMATAQKTVDAFSSTTIETSTISGNQTNIVEARKIADTAITQVNTVHDDLQSTLNALTDILQ